MQRIKFSIIYFGSRVQTLAQYTRAVPSQDFQLKRQVQAHPRWQGLSSHQNPEASKAESENSDDTEDGTPSSQKHCTLDCIRLRPNLKGKLSPIIRKDLKIRRTNRFIHAEHGM